jgi:hypothetical protein
MYLVEEKQYDYIKRLAYSNIPATQFLSVLAIEYFERKGLIRLDSLLVKRIKEVKSSEATFSTCRGCVIYESKKLKKLLRFKGKWNRDRTKMMSLIEEIYSATDLK